MRHPASHISDHLLVYLTLAFISGIAMAGRFSLTAETISHFCIGLFSILLLLAFLHYLQKRQTVLCALLPLLAALGFLHAQVALQLPRDEIHIFHRITEKTEAVVTGTLASLIEFDGKTSQILLETEYIRYRESPKLQPTTGKIILNFPGVIPKPLVPGDSLVVRADLKRPDSFKTPGAFDYAQHLARNDIWITGFVRSPLFLERLDEKQGLLHTLRYLPEQMRARIGEQIDLAVPTELSGLYRAILIGDASRVDDITLEAFKGSGTFHILSISGLHMTIIGTLLFAALYWLLSRSERLLFNYPIRKWAAFLCLPVLLGYGLLAGLNAPVFRAVIMSCIVIVAICTDRPKSASTLLAFAALIILIVDPLALFGASFQLSFVATMAIFFLFPVLKKLIFPDEMATPQKSFKQRARNWLTAGLLISVAATLATAPITLYAFNRFSPIGILANPFIEPLICLWSLPFGFLALPFMYLQPEISAWLLQAGSLGLSAAVHGTTFFANLPFSTLWLPSPPIWLMVGYYAGLLCCSIPGSVSNRWSWCSALVVSGCLVLMLYPQVLFRNTAGASLRVSVLDVGQGNSALVEFPSGMKVLVDGGGSSMSIRSVGERIIAPYLWRKGIQQLDAVVVTHPDADHYNGLDFILRNFSPGQLWVRDKHGHEDNFQNLIALAEKLRVPVIIPDDGVLLGNGPTADRVECIANLSSPGETTAPKKLRGLGNTGLVIKACSGQHCVLFPGDIGRAEEHSLINQGYDLKAEILQAPHHGSITSNSPEFLAAVAPSHLLVSAGPNSKGHFPHNHLQDDCQERGITLLATSRQGTLETEIDNGNPRILGYAKRQGNPIHPYEPVVVSEITVRQ